MGGMTPPLVRASRELLGWSTEELARQAKVSVNTVNRFQYAKGEETGIGVSVGNAMKIRQSLERAGIELINDHGRLGVVLHKPD